MVSSAKSLTVDDRSSAMSFMLKRKRQGPSTDPCGNFSRCDTFDNDSLFAVAQETTDPSVCKPVYTIPAKFVYKSLVAHLI